MKTRGFSKRFKSNILVGLILLASLAASLPLLRGGFYHFSDEPHIANLYQMVRSIESGQIPPRWAPDMSFEYGYPLFNFYYPFPFYIGTLFYLVTNSLVWSLKLTFLMTIFSSGIFMYFWLKKHASEKLAFLGALVYLFSPYRAVDLYVRGALGEAMAFAFFPLLSLWLYKSIQEGWRQTLVFSAFLGLFILTHNLALLFFIPWLLGYALIIGRKGDRPWIQRVFIAFVLGFGISSYWWAPAFIEKGLLYSQTPFNYQDHFPFIKQLIYSPFRYGASLPGIYDDISFQIGLANLLLLTLGASVLVIQRSKYNRVLFYLVISTVSFILLMNIRSSFLWELFSFANYIQFPWRLLMFTTFVTSSMVIVLDKVPKALRDVLFVAVLLLSLSNIKYFSPSEYFNPGDEYFLNRFFARNIYSTNLSDDYHNYSEDYLLLPKWVKERPSSLPEDKFTSKAVEIKSQQTLSPVSYVAEYEGSGIVEFHSYFFPGWVAEINGKRSQIFSVEPTGHIGVNASGSGNIKIYWEETVLRKTFDIVSLVSGIILFSAFIYIKNEKKS